MRRRTNTKQISLIKLAALVVLATTVLTNGFTWSKAAPTDRHSPFLLLSFEPPNRGAPGKTQDAGSRTDCPNPAIPFSTLAPSTNWGETLDSHPKFWLYVPYTAETVELVLKDERTETTLYRTTFHVSDGPGVGRFALPPDAPALEADRVYRWQFNLLCKSDNSSAYLSTTGVIVRRSPISALADQLAAASPQERITLFAGNGFWYDALAELAELRRSKPEDASLANLWADLLQHQFVGLDEIVSQPFLPENPAQTSSGNQ